MTEQTLPGQPSMVEIEAALAENVSVTPDTLCVELSEGGTLAWYPRLLDASAEEREHWRLIGRECGIHWEDLDEDISVVSKEQ